MRLWDVSKRIGPSQTTKTDRCCSADWREAAVFGMSLAALLSRAQITGHNALSSCDTKYRFGYDELKARMAKSADAADLKSAGRKRLWEFKSPSGHQTARQFATKAVSGLSR